MLTIQLCVFVLFAITLSCNYMYCNVIVDTMEVCAIVLKTIVTPVGGAGMLANVIVPKKQLFSATMMERDNILVSAQVVSLMIVTHDTGAKNPSVMEHTDKFDENCPPYCMATYQQNGICK